MSTYFAILTEVGEAKLANAIALGQTLKLKTMAVGDGNGNLPMPERKQKVLVHEVRRAGLNQLTVDPTNASQIIVEQVLPENVGGWWIREIGIFDEAGDLCAVANCPPSYKPVMAEGSARTQVVRIVLIVASTAAIELKIDPSVILATRQYVDDQDITVRAYSDAQLAKHLAAMNPHPQYSMKEVETLPKADASKKLASADFVQQEQGNLAGILAFPNSRALAAADFGKAFYFTNGSVLATLPRPDSLGNGQIIGRKVTFFGFNKISGTVAPAANASLRYDVASIASMLVKVGQSVSVVAVTADTWQVIDSTAEMWRNADFENYFNNTAPTQPQFDSSTKIATTEFVQKAAGAIGSMGVVATSRNLIASDIGSSLFFNFQGLTLTLPKPADLGLVSGTGKCVYLFGTVATGTITPGAGVTLGFNGVSVPSLTLKPGQSIAMTANGPSAWQILHSTADMFRNLDFSGELGVLRNWRRLPNGDIEQWGTVAGSASMAPFTPNLTFPIAFPNACRAITVQCMNELSSAGYSGRTTDKTLSRTGAWVSNSNGVTAVPDVLCWRAIGN
ncbi:hypothetical protein JAB1_44520 [Janthinobacterium sp. MP5059B]|uniref:phage tail protein n=1 Tax=Janthinobacterium sp. MP5059B TaxID=1766683 RepID=UPI000873A306|nr:phage tail protein [Janthinobacterium sp. MP5059B]OEZ48032.1 hypothetical protein JAB1_44520 [Janthinobacterium sp. MP5059B]